jgi:hypothetical protein
MSLCHQCEMFVCTECNETFCIDDCIEFKCCDACDKNFCNDCKDSYFGNVGGPFCLEYKDMISGR